VNVNVLAVLGFDVPARRQPALILLVASSPALIHRILMTLRRLLPALALLAIPLSGFCVDAKRAAPPADATTAAEKRKLIYQRPETKGAKYEYSGKATLNRSYDFHIGEAVQPGSRATMESTITGLLEITGVTPKIGDITGYTLTVKKMTLSDDDDASDAEDACLEAGTVITVKVENFKSTFFVNGGEVQGALNDALRLTLPDYTGVEEDLNEVLAPKGPVAKGDKWSSDVAKFQTLLEKYRTELKMDAARSSIENRYKGPEVIDGTDTDVVAQSLTTVFSKVPGLPEGATLLTAENKIELTYALARDLKVSAVRETRAVGDEKIHYSSKHDGQEFEVHLKNHSDRHQTLKPVK